MSAKTNATTFSYGIEPSFKADPSDWKVVEPNTVSTFGATISKISRNPISPNRQRRKSSIADVDSAVSMEFDVTMDGFEDFIEQLMFASASFLPAETGITSVDADSFTVPAMAAALSANTLIKVTGLSAAANNQLFLVDGTTTTTDVVVAGGGLTVDASPNSNADLRVAGIQGASGDIEIDASQNLISTVLDFTTIGLVPGMMIFIGGVSTDTDLNFGTAANRGACRVVSVTANEIILDRRAAVFSADDGLGKTIQIFFGKYITNVSVDDSLYIERSISFEAGYGFATREFEYPNGNFANSMTLNFGIATKSTFTMDFVGADSLPPSTTRKAGADSATQPTKTEPFNTSTDFARLRVLTAAEAELTSFLKDITLTISNEVTPQKCVGAIGAGAMNIGNFLVDLSTQALFTSTDVVNAIRNNDTIGMDFLINNGDGGIGFDIGSMALGDGSKNFDINEVIKINLTGEAFADPSLNNSLGVTIFPHIPA